MVDRGLTGAGPSRVGVQGAMRARDVSRPTEDDLAEAERTLVVQHAAPVPPGPLPARPQQRGRQPGSRPEAS